MPVGVEFLKGHGTENDFVVLPDPDGLLDLTESRVRALCDRRRGLGADGVLRVVRPDFGPWFMDYRNADGSIAEMCGNGVRVFSKYLVEAGLAPAGEFTIGTRAGERHVVVHDDGAVTSDMGRVLVTGTGTATVGGSAFGGVAVDVGNPHLACVTEVPVAELDLKLPPGHDPVQFPHGVNVEVLTPLRNGAVRLRVHERGSGETRSCGTGVCAAVVAAQFSGHLGPGVVDVDVPGGRLQIEVLAAGTVSMTGPAVFVAAGEWFGPR